MQMQLRAFFIRFFLFTSATAATVTDITTFSPILFSSLLSATGFKQLSDALAGGVDLSTTTQLTIFAPSDSSLLTCSSCSSFLLLLKRHSVPGLYPLRSLRALAFGTKIETLAPNHCLTITITTSAARDQFSKIVLVNGVEITRPDLFHDGAVVIHGLQGFVPDLSPLSCNVEPMISLSFPQLQPSKSVPSSIMRLMLKDAIVRLRFTGFNILALALRVKYGELSELKALTVFAVHDFSILSSGGHTYLSNFRFHVVPNMILTAQDLTKLPRGTLLITMEAGRKLLVTIASRGDSPSSATVKINYVKITTLDLIQNSRIAVHAVSVPFPQMNHQIPEEEEEKRTLGHPQVFGCDFLMEKDAIVHDAWIP